jgi:hypothetical protein
MSNQPGPKEITRNSRARENIVTVNGSFRMMEGRALVTRKQNRSAVSTPLDLQTWTEPLTRGVGQRTERE